MINKTLSELAADYANNVIDKDSYRQSRGELLSGIVAGKIAVESIDYLPPLALEDEAAITEPAATRTSETTQILGSPPQGNIPSDAASAPVVSDSKSPFPVLYVSISTAIVIVLIIAVVLFYPKPPEVSTTQISSENGNTAMVSTADSKEGEELISGFLNENIWTQEKMDEFLQSWNTLSIEQRMAASNTKRMQRLSSSIYKQFLEEKALASIDSEKAAARQQTLIDFAQALGINDSRMVIQ